METGLNLYNSRIRTTCRQNKLSVGGVPITQSIRNNVRCHNQKLKNYCKNLKISYTVITLKLEL